MFQKTRMLITATIILMALSACAGGKKEGLTREEKQQIISNPTPQQDKKFVDIIQQKAEQGNSAFQGIMAMMKYKGCATCSPDHQEALKWAQKANEQNNPMGHYVLGKLYQEGKVIQKDETKAIDLLTKASDSGLSDAYVALGEAYLEGRGVPQNFETARTWFEKGHAKGDTEATYNLGSMYDHGNGVKRDLNRAEGYYKKSAFKGDVASQLFLGQIYTTDEKKDYVKAYAWLLIAHDNRGKMVNYFGDEQQFETVKAFPKTLRDAIEKKMSRQEIEQAKDQAKEFIFEIQNTMKQNQTQAS